VGNATVVHPAPMGDGFRLPPKHFTMKMDDFSSYKSIPASNKK